MITESSSQFETLRKGAEHKIYCFNGWREGLISTGPFIVLRLLKRSYHVDDSASCDVEVRDLKTKLIYHISYETFSNATCEM